jgi:chromosome segregation ATPase
MRLIQCLALLLFTSLAAPHAAAQASRGGEGDARLQAMVNQLNSQKAQLQQENTRLQRELDELKKELGEEKKRADAAEARVNVAESSAAQLERSNTQNSAALAQTRTRLEEVVGQFRETIDILRETEADRNSLSASLSMTQSDLSQCTRNNREMYQTAIEVVEVLEGQGPAKRLAQKEPFTQLARVKIENIADEYRYALEDSLLPGQDPGSD